MMVVLEYHHGAVSPASLIWPPSFLILPLQIIAGHSPVINLITHGYQAPSA